MEGLDALASAPASEPADAPPRTTSTSSDGNYSAAANNTSKRQQRQRPPLESPKPANISESKRAVSWETNANATNERIAPGAAASRSRPPLDGAMEGDDEDESTRQSSSRMGSSNRGISLNNVINATPREDEADTYIQRSIEEQLKNEDDGDIPTLPSILGGIPDPKHGFVEKSDDDGNDGDANNNKKNHRRVQSTGETLAGLQAEMAKMQDPAHVDNLAPGEGAGTSADNFATNAIAIMQRNRAKQEKNNETTTSDATAATGPKPPNPETKWNMLRNAVNAGEVLDPKKTDAIVQDEEPLPNTVTIDIESGGNNSTNNDGDNRVSSPVPVGGRRPKKKFMNDFRSDVVSDWYDFEEWSRVRRRGAWHFFKNVVIFLLCPLISAAAILFYLVDNPPCGTQRECELLAEPIQPTAAPTMQTNSTAEGGGALDGLGEFFSGNSSQEVGTSVSYWLLFVARQVLMFCLARVVQAFVIDFVALRTRVAVHVLGAYATLWTVQSRGRPFLASCWGILDFMFLFGDHAFARHWLFYQNAVGLFNADNPSGHLTEADPYRTILILAICIGIVITGKRVWIGLYLGKKTFSAYSADLTNISKKVILIGQVASLARDMEVYGFELDDLRVHHGEVYERAMSPDKESTRSLGTTGQRSRATAISDLNSSQRVKLNELLGAWEEPTLAGIETEEEISISSIIQFRRSLQTLSTRFPFSVAFGLANSRENCIQSAERLFNSLKSASHGEAELNFDILALLAVSDDGFLDEQKLREVVQLFRPTREGTLSLLDFAKSIDSVYKDLRLLRASVANTSRIDRAFEQIVNTIFYFLLACAVLAVVGVNPLVLFASVSGFIIGLSFMIGSAASKYFEGLLLILVRDPYNVGDRVAVSDVNNDTSASGSATWFVKDVTLFTTTVVFAATNEVATYSNGSLAGSRIINAARSPQAVLHFLLKFPIKTPYSKLNVFKSSIEKFVKDRPREWISFAGFRATRVEADAGFVEYIVVGQHREGWQNMGALLSSKADLSSFALELSKRLGIQYTAPALPVDLRVQSGNLSSLAVVGSDQAPGTSRQESVGTRPHESQSEFDFDGLEAMFSRPNA